MTSVAVISSAVERINRLKNGVNNLQSEGGLPKETDQLLEQLGKIKDTLELAAHDPKTKAAGSKFVDLEKQAVRLSYEIVDAIVDVITDAASFNIVDAIADAAPFIFRRKPGCREQLGKLQKDLTNLQGELQKKNHDEGTAGLPGPDQNPGQVEIQEKKPKKGHSFNRKNSLQVWKKEVQIKNREGSPRASPARSEGSPQILVVPDQDPVIPDQDPVEQKDSMNMLREELMKTESSSEMYLVGKSGMGKTTLARKLFHDPQIRDFFKVFAWVPITQNFHIKKVFQLLLQQLGPQPDIREMNEIDLISRIFAHLKGKRYLLVLEDIEAADDWESIRLALPTAQSSRVIITTSIMDIAQGSKDCCHRISGLTQTDIIALLKDEDAFRSDKVGEAIHDISGGSPLIATILGKSTVSAKEDEKQLVDELQSYKNRRGTPRVLEASYKRLDSEVKALLLYLGQFPAGQDVDVDKLYLLLTAENLIVPQKDSDISPQCLIEYLKELERLKLVHVQEDHVAPTRGLYKSCRLHDQVWDFCKFKAPDEEFLEIVDFESSAREEVGPHTRRLAVYLRGDGKSVPHSIRPATLKKLLTLVIVDTFERKSGWPSELNDLTELSYLRVLSFDEVNFKVRPFPRGLERLFLLRYLSFRGCFLEELPSVLSILTQLETLDLLVRDECNLKIPINVFAHMKRMVHLYFPGKYRSGGVDGRTKLKLQGMEKLEILVNFDTEICEVGALKQLKNLKILSTISEGKLDDAIFEFLTQGYGKELQYSSVDITSFDCYCSDSLSELKKLLGCKSIHSLHIEGRIGELPKEEGSEGYAETIGEIFLNGSQLQTDPMTYLGKFQNLHSLVLSNDAFLGREITVTADLFPNLRSLKLQSLQYLEKLTIQNNATPMLSSLQIHGCASLREVYIPKELDERLKKTQESNGSDAYSVIPSPAHFSITP